MNWHAKFGAVLAIFDFSKKVRGRSCPQPFIYTSESTISFEAHNALVEHFL